MKNALYAISVSLGIVACILVAAVVVFLLIGMCTDFRPKPVTAAEELHEDLHQEKGLQMPDSLKIMTWNLGYGGLGDNMDFFYDGGTMVRDTRERVTQNTEALIGELKRHRDVDIFLLQEVDRNSKRSWGIDQTRLLKEAFPDYHLYFAYNYKSFYVPMPLRDPVGKVGSGVVLLSRYKADEVLRHQFPTRFPYPVSIFHLKKCLMTARFTMADGRTIIIGDTHNTAYDHGNKRSIETGFIADHLKDWEEKGWKVIIGGDWNQYPGEYTPAKEEGTVLYSTVRLEDERLTPYGSIEFPRNGKTLRHLEHPLNAESVTTVTDYFFLSHGITAENTWTIPLNFRNSDHNPVLTEVHIGR